MEEMDIALKIYCLDRHFAALYRQSICHELADFTEPCAECKYLGDNERCAWNRCQIPVSSGIDFTLLRGKTGDCREDGSECDKAYVHYEKHMAALNNRRGEGNAV